LLLIAMDVPGAFGELAGKLDPSMFIVTVRRGAQLAPASTTAPTLESPQDQTRGGSWFVVRAGAERKGMLIKIPFMYTGSEILAAARAFVFGERVFGVKQ
jgi:hypothetical protein